MGLLKRIDTVAGDFFADSSLPGGYDTILLSMILHDWAEDRCRVILQKCWSALPSGGRVIIAELLVNDAWLDDLGFQDIRTVWFEAPGANGAVIGRKP